MKIAEEFGIFMKSRNQSDVPEIMEGRMEEEKHNFHLVTRT